MEKEERKLPEGWPEGVTPLTLEEVSVFVREGEEKLAIQQEIIQKRRRESFYAAACRGDLNIIVHSPEGF